MKQRFLVPGLILLGLCVLGLGMGWNHVVPTAAYWGAEQAQEYSIAQSDLHAKQHSHGDDELHEQEAAAARERFVKIYQELEQARSSHSRTGIFFVAAGLAILLLGIVMHLMVSRPG